MEYIKAISDVELDVLAIPFDTVDSDGQWFDANTDIMPENFNTPVIIYQHGIESGAKDYQRNPVAIASPVKNSLEKRSDGWHIRVVFDKITELSKQVIDAAKRGLVAVSSGTVGHLSRLDDGKGNLIPYSKYKKGRIAVWPFAELSLWDMQNGNMQPANNTAYAVPALKALYEMAGMDLPNEIQPEASGVGAVDNTKSNTEKKEMETNEVQKLIEDALKAQAEANAEAQKAAKSRQDEIDAEVKKQVDAVKAEAAKGRRLPDFDGQAPHMTQFNDRKYDNYSASDLALASDVLRSKGIKASDRLHKSMLLKVISEKATSTEREQDLNYIKSSIPAHLQDENALKAAEVMATSDTGNGAEWVATLYSPEIWRTIRHDGGIVSKIPSSVISDGYNNEYVPLEDADPTWYTVPETTANDSTMLFPVASVPASKAGTGQKNITLTKKGARTVYSGELTEDSIVPFASQLREQLGISGRELMEAWVINADSETGATTNINDIGGTPAATDWFLGGNGFRKLALVTNTANSRSAGGALAIEDYLETMKLMGTAGIAAADMSKLSFIVDPNVHFANMNLPEVKTRDVFSAATIENGFLKYVYGVQILPSWQYHKGATGLKANTSGKVDLDTQGNNTTGAFVCVRWDQWKMKYKRRMTIELTRFANSDSYEIVALTRFGMGYRDSEASATSYNVGI